MSDEAAALLRYIKVNLTSLDEARLPDEYYYASLPLCVIDAVFSIGVRYESTRRTVKHWCQSQVPAWPMIVRIPSTEMRRGSHSIRQFINTLKGESLESLARTAFNNRQRTSTRNGILKAEAVYKFATVLEKFGIDDFGDMVDQQRSESAKSCVMEIEGQRSGISFDYFQMLAGSDYHVKADRMLRGFVSDAINTPMLSADSVRKLVRGVFPSLQTEFPLLTPRLLDYEIWNFQRSRKPIQRFIV